jgi:hypothetical protein
MLLQVGHFTTALLLLYCCFTTVLRLRLMRMLLQQWTRSSGVPYYCFTAALLLFYDCA